MINVIKEGSLPKRTKTIYIITCPLCKCEFECEDSDLTTEKRINGKRSITCPCCKSNITLNRGDFLGSGGNYKTREEEIVDAEEPIEPNDSPNEVKGLYGDVKCPHCGKQDFTLGASVSTAAYCATRYKDGKVVSKDCNIHTTYCHCNECGKTFKIVNGKVEK